MATSPLNAQTAALPPQKSPKFITGMWSVIGCPKIFWIRKETAAPAKRKHLTSMQREREKILFVFLFPEKDIEDVTLLFMQGQGFILEFRKGICFPLKCD